MIFCSLPVPKSLADTLTMPFRSTSKLTSIWGTPRGAGGMPVSWKRPKVTLSAAIARSPWRTWMSTAVCPSAAVVKIRFLLVGMAVLRSIKVVITPPRVSIPSDKGMTSTRTMSLTSPASTPAWMAAPMATHSSGLIPLLGSFPRMLRIASWTAGILVDPPTKMISSISFGSSPASAKALWVGPMVASTRSLVNSLNLALVISMSRWSGPLGPALIKGRLMLVACSPESSILAFSAASFSRWVAMRSWSKSIPCSFLNSAATYSISRRSKSSPPKRLLPLVALTSKTPSPTSRIDTSKVPPPRSKTRMVWSDFLSRP